MLIAALGVGITKSGLTGVSMVHVLIFASIFDARESTGIVLPMLIFGDAAAMVVYGKHANWTYIRKMLGPTLVGIILGAIAMQFLSGAAYRPLLGVIILGLVSMQIVRIRYPQATENIPHSVWFAWSMGMLGGAMTMVANGAGPVNLDAERDSLSVYSIGSLGGSRDGKAYPPETIRSNLARDDCDDRDWLLSALERRMYSYRVDGSALTKLCL